MTSFNVLVGESKKKDKELDIDQAIEIMKSVKSIFFHSGKKYKYAISFADLIKGSSHLKFFIEMENDNSDWKIMPSEELSRMCLSSFSDFKGKNISSAITKNKKISGFKTFFATARKTPYDIKILIGEDKNDKDNFIIFSQKESIAIYNKYIEHTGVKTITCKAQIKAIDIASRHIKAEVVACNELKNGEIIKASINQLVVRYCIIHHLNIEDTVMITVDKNNNNRYRLLNLSSDTIVGTTLF